MNEGTGYTELAPKHKSMMRLGVLLAFIYAGALIAAGILMGFLMEGEGAEFAAMGTGIIPLALGAKVLQKNAEANGG